MMLDLYDVGLPVHVTHPGRQDVGAIGAIADVVVLAEDPHRPGMGEYRLDRFFARRAEGLGRFRHEAADLKEQPTLDIDRLGSLDAPLAAERIRPFYIEKNRRAEELSAAPARSARGQQG